MNKFGGERFIRSDWRAIFDIYFFQWNSHTDTRVCTGEEKRNRERMSERVSEKNSNQLFRQLSQMRFAGRTNHQKPSKVYSNMKHKGSALPFWCDASLSICVSVWKLVTHFFFSRSLSHSWPLGWCVALFILLRFFSVASTSKTKIYL